MDDIFDSIVPKPYLFLNGPTWGVQQMGELYQPYGAMAREVAQSLVAENEAFRPSADFANPIEFEDRIRELAQDIYAEIDTYYQWLDWETEDRGLARGDLVYPHNCNAEILLEYIENEEASGSFVADIQKKYSLKDPLRVMVSIQLLTELDLLRARVQYSKPERYQRWGENLKEGFITGSYLKSMGMLYSVWRCGVLKSAIKKQTSITMKARGALKGCKLRKKILATYDNLKAIEPGIKGKDAYTQIAAELWQDEDVRQEMTKKGVSKGDFQEKTVKGVIYNHTKRIN